MAPCVWLSVCGVSNLWPCSTCIVTKNPKLAQGVPTAIAPALVFRALNGLSVRLSVCCSLSLLPCRTCIVPNNPKLPPGAVAAIAVIGSFLLLNILAVVAFAIWNALQFRRSRFWEKDIQLCRRYTWEEITQATGNFGQENFLGKGGFGSVYKGVLATGETVAVKRAARVVVGSEGKGKFEEEVLAVHNLSHKSLVRLLGYCSESRERVLVYEYMAGGALSEHLFEGYKDPLLSFSQRLGVAIDVAEGLKYLHNFASTPLVHRDIKPENILLDETFRATVADFGLARQVQPQEAHHTNIAGTALNSSCTLLYSTVLCCTILYDVSI